MLLFGNNWLKKRRYSDNPKCVLQIFRPNCIAKMSEMDKLSEHFDLQLERIAMLNDFIVIFGQRKILNSALIHANDTTDENRALIALAKDKLHRFRTVLLPQVKREIAKCERLQTIMLNMVEALDEEDQHETRPQTDTLESEQNNKENYNPLTPSASRVSVHSCQIPSNTQKH